MNEFGGIIFEIIFKDDTLYNIGLYEKPNNYDRIKRLLFKKLEYLQS